MYKCVWWVARIPSIIEQDVVVTYPTSSKYFFQPSPESTPPLNSVQNQLSENTSTHHTTALPYDPETSPGSLKN